MSPRLGEAMSLPVPVPNGRFAPNSNVPFFPVLGWIVVPGMDGIFVPFVDWGVVSFPNEGGCFVPFSEGVLVVVSFSLSCAEGGYVFGFNKVSMVGSIEVKTSTSHKVKILSCPGKKMFTYRPMNPSQLKIIVVKATETTVPQLKEMFESETPLSRSLRKRKLFFNHHLSCICPPTEPIQVTVHPHSIFLASQTATQRFVIRILRDVTFNSFV